MAEASFGWPEGGKSRMGQTESHSCDSDVHIFWTHTPLNKAVNTAILCAFPIVGGSRPSHIQATKMHSHSCKVFLGSGLSGCVCEFNITCYITDLWKSRHNLTSLDPAWGGGQKAFGQITLDMNKLLKFLQGVGGVGWPENYPTAVVPE